MSWPLASTALVAIVLAIGWLAYERARPSARSVAVVATLAAIAALGRDAFVALPDVKPITAMTFVVGYALGPVSGFSVGALGMLASNVLLGQGPYTPWQMAAWGLVGIAGAAIGRLSGRRLGRVGVALCCAFAALGAKQVMNVYTWAIGASHTPAALLAVAAAALPFDLTDMVASGLFGFAFGPELARLLARARARMNVSWEPAAPAAALERARGPLALVLAGLLAASFAPARPAGAVASLGPELSYLRTAQNADGGFGAAPGQASSELFSAWTAMGLAASGRDPASVRRGSRSVLGALQAGVGSLQGAGDLERTILAARACGVSPHAFAGRDLVAEMDRARVSDGSYSRQLNLTAFAVFALRAAGHSAHFSPIRRAVAWIEHQQGGDGGFGFAARGSPSDVDDTAAALQALVDGDARDVRALRAAANYLLRSQNLDGGYPQERGGESNAQSTAWAIQGLVASHRDPLSVHRHGSRSPVGYLQSLVAPDGSVRYSRTRAQTPVWVTAQAVIALSGRTFPVER